jgi:DeoR/GlpR family transcriptional regulator of sugar metabolism
MSSSHSADEPVFAPERHDVIAALLASRGKVSIAQLSAKFGVSEQTIRRDLIVLEQRGLLRRTHGGALGMKAPTEEQVESRAVVHSEAKRLIADSCLREVRPGMAVYLDTGTSVAEIARGLRGHVQRLTVVTNSLTAAELVCDLPGITHVLLGGQLRRLSGSLTGPLALGNLEQFTFDVAFIGVSGLTEDGITVSDLGEAQLKRHVATRSRKVVVPLDASKFGVTDFARVGDLDLIDLLVSDSEDKALQNICASKNLVLRTLPHQSRNSL